jgi:hypothetical protein
VTMMASEDEAVTLDAEMICHDGKPAETTDPREGTDLAMTTARTVAAIRISITPLATTMTKGKAPAAMTTIYLHEEQTEAIVAAKISRRTARVNDGVILRHPHQGAPMAAAVVVADQQGHATPARIRQTRSPTTPVPISTRLPSLKQPSSSAQSALDNGFVMSPSRMGSKSRKISASTMESIGL